MKVIGLVEGVPLDADGDGLADLARMEGQGGEGERRVVAGRLGAAVRRGIGDGHGQPGSSPDSCWRHSDSA